MIPELPVVGVHPSAASGRLTGCAALVKPAVRRFGAAWPASTNRVVGGFALGISPQRWTARGSSTWWWLLRECPGSGLTRPAGGTRGDGATPSSTALAPPWSARARDSAPASPRAELAAPATATH